MTKEPKLSSLHPLHFADQHYNRSLMSPGLHGSFFLNLPHVSRSPELSRAYQMGDPVRLIDWKAFARNDQLIVREERDEAMASVVVVLDGRSTMLWPDENVKQETNEDCVTKFSVATRVALHLVHRHVRLGDRVRLVLLEDAFSKDEVPGVELRSPSDVLSLFEELEKKQFDADCLRSFLRPHSFFYARTNLLFWISDCCEGSIPEEYLMQSQNSMLFHTLSFLECDSSWFGDRICYFDNALAQKEFLGENLKRKNQYMEKIQNWCKSLQKRMETHHGSYVLLTDKSSIRSYVASLDKVMG